MKKQFLSEVFRIKEIMGLLVEGRPLISKFNFDDIIKRDLDDDVKVKSYDFNSGTRKLETLADLENELSYINRKDFANFTAEDKAFLKDFNSKILDFEDVVKLAESLKNDFMLIRGDDLAKAKFLNEMGDVLDESQLQNFKNFVAPNKYETFSVSDLKKIWTNKEVTLKTTTPTPDDVKLLEILVDRGVITPKDYQLLMKSTPGFSQAYTIYDKYLKFNEDLKTTKGTTITWEQYLKKCFEKDPKLSGNAGVFARKMAQPWFNVAKGLTGDFKSSVKGALGVLTEVATFGGIIGGGFFGFMKLILFFTDAVGEKVNSAVSWLEDYTGTSDEVLLERWKKYWSYDDPQVLLSNNTKESVYTDARNSTITKGNAPTYERLGKTNNLKLLQIKMNIGGTETDTIQFKLNKSYILSGDETFSPDVISLPPKEPVNPPDELKLFEEWIKKDWAAEYKGTETFRKDGNNFIVSDGVNDYIYIKDGNIFKISS
jgi:hypothetical protein